MWKMKYLLILIAAITFLSPNSEAQGMKIGFINLRQIFENTSVYRTTFEELRNLQKQKSEEIQSKEDQLRKSRYELEVRKDLMTEENARQLEQNFRQEVNEFQDQLRNEQEEFSELRDEKLEPINNQLKGVIEEVAKNENYAMILKFDDLLYADPKFDITNKVIDLMNK